MRLCVGVGPCCLCVCVCVCVYVCVCVCVCSHVTSSPLTHTYHTPHQPPPPHPPYPPRHLHPHPPHVPAQSLTPYTLTHKLTMHSRNAQACMHQHRRNQIHLYIIYYILYIIYYILYTIIYYILYYMLYPIYRVACRAKHHTPLPPPNVLLHPFRPLRRCVRRDRGNTRNPPPVTIEIGTEQVLTRFEP